MTPEKLIIAIDGPAGSGKSTIAKGLAQRLDGRRLDTGAIYRAFAWFALKKGCALDDETALADLGSTLDLQLGDRGLVLVNGRDVSGEIRTPKIGQTASKLAALPKVRQALLELQRENALPGPTVCEGRDIGTVVFPQAPLKFFLTASPEERARRRFLELQAKGNQVEYEAILAEQRRRDLRDSTRAVAPLRAAPDALTIDSTPLTIEEVIGVMYEKVQALLGYPGKEGE